MPPGAGGLSGQSTAAKAPRHADGDGKGTHAGRHRVALDVACAAQEVERLVLRPHVRVRGIYYGVCLLNQFILARNEPTLANYLIK